MSDKVVYLVYENFDNCEEYESHDHTHEVMAVCTTKELAEKFIEERCDEILNKEYKSYFEYDFKAKCISKEHKIIAKKRYNEDDEAWWDILVWAEDGYKYANTLDTGVYEFEIVETILNKRSS